MITVLSYLEKMNNISLLQEEFHSQAAYYSDEDWKYYLYTKIEELKTALKKDPVLDILCWNVGGKEAISELEKTREKYREAFLLLIADSTISPMEYLRPSILPTALLLRPFSRPQCEQVLGELISSYCSKFRSKEDEEVFLIETREGNRRVPLSQISYVEAREPVDREHPEKGERYLWQDKAGGYGIQTGWGSRMITGITGDYYNVVGLPVCRLSTELSRLFDRHR